MNRREFLKYSGFLTSASIISAFGMPSCSINKTKIPDMRLYWQGWKTGRPFTPDIDYNGKLWHGNASLFCSDPDNNVTEEIDSSYLNGQPLSTVLCQGDNVYILVQKSPFLYVYRQDKKVFDRFPLPEPESNIWFGTRAPGDHRLYLYARNLGKLVIWDTDIDKGTAINYPDKLDLWSGFYVKNDEAIYSFTLDAKPCRLIRFDLKKQEYDAIIPAPDANLEITGVNPVGETLYCSDRFTGRIFPFNYVHRTWGDPVTAPGIGTEYGFVGMGCSYRGLALYCLSTYQGKMKYDFNTNKYLSQKEEDIGIDGLPHHFLNKYLVYDPAENKFSYLNARAPGRYPLLCYSLVHKDKLIITGFDIWNATENFPDMKTKGELLIFHN